jgi:hypothetical protein
LHEQWKPCCRATPNRNNPNILSRHCATGFSMFV